MKIDNTKNINRITQLIKSSGLSGLDPEIQTTKIEGKLVACVDCKRPLVVNRFYAPDRAKCKKLDCNKKPLIGLSSVSNSISIKSLSNTRLNQLIKQTKTEYPHCQCDMPLDMTTKDLRKLDAGCTAPRYVCERLSSIRRQL